MPSGKKVRKEPRVNPAWRREGGLKAREEAGGKRIWLAVGAVVVVLGIGAWLVFRSGEPDAKPEATYLETMVGRIDQSAEATIGANVSTLLSDIHGEMERRRRTLEEYEGFADADAVVVEVYELAMRGRIGDDGAKERAFSMLAAGMPALRDFANELTAEEDEAPRRANASLAQGILRLVRLIDGRGE